MQPVIINPLEVSGWDDILLTNSDYSVFYSTGWITTLSESYGYTPFFFALIHNTTLFALIPVMEVKSFITGKRGISLPFSDYCEPIISDQNDFGTLIDFIIKYGNKASWKFLELRGGGCYIDKKPYTTYYHHILDLTKNKEEIFSNLRSSTQRNIRKATREGVAVNICSSFKSVKEFYKLNCITRKLHGLPPQPFYFFKNLHRYMISNKYGNIFLAYYDSKPIAGAVYLHFGKKAIFKYGASNKKYQHVRPNDAVMWEAVKTYAEQEYLSLSLGRTHPENKGLLQFKNGWNAKCETVKYYHYQINSTLYKTRRCKIKKKVFYQNTYMKYLKLLPVPLLRLIGTFMYRHLA